MQDLILAAEAAAVPFETSDDGTFVRFTANGRSIYVVRNAWRGGYTVLTMDGGVRTQVGQFPDAEEAVAAAADALADPTFPTPLRLSPAPRRLAS